VVVPVIGDRLRVRARHDIVIDNDLGSRSNFGVEGFDVRVPFAPVTAPSIVGAHDSMVIVPDLLRVGTRNRIVEHFVAHVGSNVATKGSDARRH
jgi:hypothetical protein